MISIFKSKILEIEKPTRDLRIIRLSVPKDFEFKAGQYLSLSVFRSDGAKIRRPLSISNPPSKKGKNNCIEFCIKLIPKGLASGYIKKLKVGDEVELFGPAGKFLIHEDENKDLIFLAAGVGIAPFASIIPDLLNKKFRREIILLKSSRDEKSALYDKEFSKLEKEYKNFRFQNIFSQPKNKKSENRGHIQEFLEKYVPEYFKGKFYICGLQEMIEETKEKLKSLGFKEEQMFEEKFD